jgi:hypothetical protein
MDYFLLRPDGTGVIDGRLAMIDGERVVHGRPQGYVLLPDGAEPPSLEAVVAPGFEWPDLPLAIQEFTLFETVVPEWDHLNRIAAPGSGTVNMATGELIVEARMP